MVRHKRAGFVIFGKTSTPELASNVSTEPVLFGPTRNPWDTTRVAGGSSGGAAAAVAARMLPLAHATDGGGSIRIPASCCGVFGFKPSRGRNPEGPWYHGPLLGVEHGVSITVRDSAALLDATHGAIIGDPYWAPPPTGAYLDEVGRVTGTAADRLLVRGSLRGPGGLRVLRRPPGRDAPVRGARPSRRGSGARVRRQGPRRRRPADHRGRGHGRGA